MQRDDIKVDGQAVGITGEAARKAAATGDGPSASLMPRQAGRGRGRIGLAGARGGRGGRGRGGLGFGGSTRPASTVTSSQGDTGAVKMETAEVNSAEKSQDEFRKMLSK